MRNKRFLDGGIAAGLIGLSVYLYLQARQFPMGSDQFPKVMLIIIIALAAMMMVSALRAAGRVQPSARKAAGRRDTLRPYALFLSICGYTGSILLVGFFPATVGWGLVLMPVLEAGRKRIYLGILTGTVVFIFFLFAYFLHVPLPGGILFE